MPIKKKKISELTLADSMVGLYTIGVKMIEGVQTSVKVSLEFIKTAYDNVVKATQDAVNAANSANTAARNANTAKLNAESATAKANTASANAITATNGANAAKNAANNAAERADTATTNANNARIGLETIKENAVEATNKANNAAKSANEKAVYAENQGDAAKTQANRAKEFSDHQPYMGDNGNWWKWDEAKKAYIDTGILAKGGVIYPTFSIDENDMNLYMSFEDEVSPQLVKFDKETGELYLNVG